MEHVAEIGARLLLARVGPEQIREPLPGLRRLAVEEQVGEQRLSTRGLERHRSALTAKLEFAKEADAERCSHVRRAPSTPSLYSCTRSTITAASRFATPILGSTCGTRR
jgi:hypothetical protein